MVSLNPDQPHAHLLASSSIALAVLDNEGLCIDANSSYLNWYGLSREECVAKAWWNHGQPKKTKKLHQEWVSSRSMDAEPKSILIGQLNNHDKYKLESNVSPGVHLLTVYRQTIQTEAEPSGQESKDFYQLLFEHNPQPMWMYNPETLQFLAVNQAAVRCYGYSSEEFLSMSVRDIVPTEDVPFLDNQYEINIGNKIWKHLTKTKQILEVEIQGNKINFQGHETCLILITDITQRRHTERALSQIEKRFQHIVCSAVIGFVVSNAKGEILEVNNAFLELIGYTKSEFEAQSINWRLLTPAEFINLDETAILQLAESGHCEPYEKEYIHKDGRRVPIQISITLLEGHRDTYSCFIQDLTKLKRTLSELVESETRLSLITSNMSDSINTYNIQHEAVYANPAFEQLTGYTLADLHSQKNINFAHPDDLVMLQQIKERVYLGESSEGVEFRIVTKAGQQKWCLGAWTPIIDKSGHQIGVMGIKSDITERKLAEAALANSEQRFRSLVQNSSDIITILDVDGIILYSSDTAVRVLGLSAQELIGQNAFDGIHPDDVDFTRQGFRARITNPDNPNNVFEYRYRHQDGRWLYLESFASNLLNDENIRGIVVNSREITERKIVEKELLESKQMIQSIANATPNIIYLYDLTLKRTIYVNQAVTTILDLTPKQIIDQSPLEWQNLIHPDNTTNRDENIRAVNSSSNDKVIETEYRHQDRQGRWRWLNIKETVFSRETDGQPQQVVGTIEDITDRKAMEETLVHDAFYDTLTGLPNRNLFVDRLNRAVDESRVDTQNLFAVLFIDLDRFKIVNDSLGHNTGDQLLIAIALRLKACLQPTDLVARLGGDEFTILLTGIQDFEEVTKLADQIQVELAMPFNLDRYEVYITPSIGIALSTTGYEHAEDLLRDADTAMYRAKALGRGRYEIFDKKMHTKVLELLKMEADLRRAMDRKEFQLDYQPIISLKTGKITGCEALIRWNHPEKGLIPPGEFIGLAEETGLIMRIDRWALHTACLQNKMWQLAGLPLLQVSVNLSIHQLKQKNLSQIISRLLAETNLDPQFLKIELTESVVMDNTEIAVKTLQELQAMGIDLAIDDFGTGYSSLAYLKQLPINTLKIDQSFIRDITTEPDSAAIAKAIISLAHNLNLKVIAEGVENADQLSFLSMQQCDEIQGFLFSPPLTAENFTKLLQTENYMLLDY